MLAADAAAACCLVGAALRLPLALRSWEAAPVAPLCRGLRTSLVALRLVATLGCDAEAPPAALRTGARRGGGPMAALPCPLRLPLLLRAPLLLRVWPLLPLPLLLLMLRRLGIVTSLPLARRRAGRRGAHVSRHT